MGYIGGVWVVTSTVVTESNTWDLCFSSINVNSLNVSSYKEGHCKTLEKLVAITGGGSDIIFMSDCRLGSVGFLSGIFSPDRDDF